MMNRLYRNIKVFKQAALPLLTATLVLLLSACRTDDTIVYMENEDTGIAVGHTSVAGMYVLNEGNMGSNKCTLDYLDLSDSTVHYLRNIYAERNPNEVKELGDVGNDVKIYGSRLWLVINCSNKVEVCRATDAVKIGKVNIPNCRYVTFEGGYAYVSSYVGPVAVGSDAPRGMVYKVDTLTLQKVDSCVVGYQPEELVACHGRLYVANSGGYNPPDYDSSVSVVNLKTMQQERQVDVAVNLHHLRLDRYNQLWVTSRGNYGEASSNLYCLRIAEDGEPILTETMNVEVSDLCIVGDSLYYYGVGWNQETQKNTRSFGIINVRTHQVVTDTLSTAPELAKMRMPYGIIVNERNRDFYLMDAKNYVSSGELLHFHADGSFDYKVKTGDIPAHAAFLYKAREE